MAPRPFDSQYEDPYDPWPKGGKNWLLWLFFIAPGQLITWKEYMFPEPGQVWASKRRAHNKIVLVMYSLGFWISLVALAFYAHVLYRAYLIKYQPIDPVLQRLENPFTPEALDRTRASIRQDYQSRGFRVLNVSMNNPQGNKLNGYITLLVDGQYKSTLCHVTIENNNIKWTCG